MALLNRRRHLQGLLALSGTAAATGCATILYPERKGNDSGLIDVGPLVLDILWFIPGLIPGIIALVVDFGTGAIYLGGGGSGNGKNKKKARASARRLAVRHGERITVRAPGSGRGAIAYDVPDDLHAMLRLITSDGTVLDAHGNAWSAGQGTDLVVNVPEAVARPNPRGPVPDQDQVQEVTLELTLHRADRPLGTASHPLRVGWDDPARA